MFMGCPKLRRERNEHFGFRTLSISPLSASFAYRTSRHALAGRSLNCAQEIRAALFEFYGTVLANAFSATLAFSSRIIFKKALEPVLIMLKSSTHYY
jgi:hypothetical protein